MYSLIIIYIDVDNYNNIVINYYLLYVTNIRVGAVLKIALDIVYYNNRRALKKF